MLTNELKEQFREEIQKRIKEERGLQKRIAAKMNETEDFMSKLLNGKIKGDYSVFMLSRIAEEFLGMNNDWVIQGFNAAQTKKELEQTAINEYIRDCYSNEWLNRFDYDKLDIKLRNIDKYGLTFDDSRDLWLSDGIGVSYKQNNPEIYNYTDSARIQESNVDNILVVSDLELYYDRVFFPLIKSGKNNAIVIDSFLKELSPYLNSKGYRTASLDLVKEGRQTGYIPFDITEIIDNQKKIEEFLSCCTSRLKRRNADSVFIEDIIFVLKSVFLFIYKNHSEIYNIKTIEYLLYKTLQDFDNEKYFFEQMFISSDKKSEEYEMFSKIKDKDRATLSTIYNEAFNLVHSFSGIFISEPLNNLLDEKYILFIERKDYINDWVLNTIMKFLPGYLESDESSIIFFNNYVNYYIENMEDYIKTMNSMSYKVFINTVNLYCLTRFNQKWLDIVNKMDVIATYGHVSNEDMSVYEKMSSRCFIRKNDDWKECNYNKFARFVNDRDMDSLVYIDKKLYLDTPVSVKEDEDMDELKNDDEFRFEQFNKVYNEPFGSEEYDGENNIILSDKYRISLDYKGIEECGKHLNQNVLILGGSGTGKSHSLIEPNILQANCSFIVTDPYGYYYAQYSNFLKKMGYEIKRLNIRCDSLSASDSNFYNPLTYVEDEEDVQKLVQILILSTTPFEKRTSVNSFWESSEKALLHAVIGYLCLYSDNKCSTFKDVIDFLNKFNGGENQESEADQLFNKIEDQESFVYKSYQAFRMSAGMTSKSIIISASVRLQPFLDENLWAISNKDDMELGQTGYRKTAIFIITSDINSGCSFFADIFLNQLCHILYKGVLDAKNPRYPVHIRFLLDEYAHCCEIYGLDLEVATCRQRNISFTISLQSLEQLKMLYGSYWESVTENCSSIVYLGSPDMTTDDFIEKLISKCGNKKVENKMMKYSKDFRRGRIGQGRCIVFIQGNLPVIDGLYNVKNHKNYNI